MAEKKTQQQVLAELVKKLGYKSYNELPVRSFLEEKLVNGTLTVRESVVLDLYARGITLQEATKATPIGKVFAEMFPPESKTMPGASPAPSSISSRANAVLNSTIKAGFTLDTPFKDISNSREAMEKIAKHTQSIDPHWSGIFNSLKGTHTRVTDDAPFVYQNPKEKASGLSSAKQSRQSSKFDGIPPAKEAFPEIVAGLSTVEDATTKNALIASSLAPYRPGEIAELRLGKYDMSTIEVDRPPGYFDVDQGAIIFPEGKTGNKAAQTLYLDKNSILYQTLAAQATEAQSLGSARLFPGMTTGKMTAAIQENITPRMAKFEDILGRPFNESKDFRKLVASMIVGELGYASEAEKMLGHTDAQLNAELTKVGQKHYISTIVRTNNPLAAVQLSLENMIGEAIGATTLNETAAAYGLDIPGFTDETANPITITRTGEELSEKTVVQPRQMTEQELASLDARQQQASANAREAAQEAEARALALEEANLAKSAELETKRREEAERRKALKGASKEEQAAAEAAKRAEAIKMDDDEARKMMDIMSDFMGTPVGKGITKAAVALPVVGLAAAGAARVEAAEQRVQAGEGVMPAYLKEGARFAIEEFADPTGMAFSKAEAIQERGKQLLEESTTQSEEELLRSFGEFGAEVRGIR